MRICQYANGVVQNKMDHHNVLMNTIISDNLKKELDKRGWGPYDLERACAAKGKPVPQATIYRILKGGHRDPRTSTIANIAYGLGISEQQLRGFIQTEETSQNLTFSKMNRIAIIGAVEFKTEGYSDMARAFHDVGFVIYPTNDLGSYAIRCAGDTLSPRYQDGEFLIIEPKTEYLPGDEVLITAKAGGYMAKKFLYEREGKIHCSDINSTTPGRALSLEDIASVHFIAGSVKRATWLKN